MLIYGLLIITIGELSSAQDACRTPDGRNGACISLSNCPELYNVLQQKPISSGALERLAQFSCGFDGSMPNVCCGSGVPQPSTTRAPPINLQGRPVFTVRPAPSASGQAVALPKSSNSSGNSQLPNVVNHVNMKLLNHDICGPITAQKITGGEKTGVLDYPWMALIAYRIGNKTVEYRCSGSIINKRYILTAAHCVTGLPTSLTLLGVRVGDHNLHTERDCDKDPATGLEVVCAERYQDFSIQSTIPHPDYSRVKVHNDIALIRLKNDIDFRPDNVKPICLPIGSAANLQHNSAVVTGWGSTESSPKSHNLLQVNVPIVPNDQCFEIYKSRKEIWYKQICAGGKQGKDSCHGDSGGPLQATGMYNNAGRYIQYGIVSFGTRSCAVEGTPGVYTRVSYYTDWILNNIRA